MEPTSKRCTKCRQEKLLDEFSPRAQGVLGRMSWCRACRQRDRDYRKSELNLAKRRRYADSQEYRDASRLYRKKWREKNRVLISERNSRRRLAVRLAVLERYGGKCECCGEHRVEFLAIDHVNGGGTKERKVIGPHRIIYKLYQADGVLPGYRVLCHNCNSSVAYYGYCPHQRERNAPLALEQSAGLSFGLLF